MFRFGEFSEGKQKGFTGNVTMKSITDQLCFFCFNKL